VVRNADLFVKSIDTKDAEEVKGMSVRFIATGRKIATLLEELTLVPAEFSR
jgi:hypothetical protein